MDRGEIEIKVHVWYRDAHRRRTADAIVLGQIAIADVTRLSDGPGIDQRRQRLVLATHGIERFGGNR